MSESNQAWVDDEAPRTRRRGRGLLALLALLAFAGAATGGAFAVRSESVAYRSTTLLTIDQPLVVAATRDAGPIEKLSRLRLQYVGLLRTDTLAVPIGEQVGLSAKTVSSRLTAQALPDSLLLSVSATGPDADAAQRLASASAEQLVTYARTSQEQYAIPSGQRVLLEVATPAGPGRADTRSDRTVISVAGFLGLAAAGLVLAVGSLVRRREP